MSDVPKIVLDRLRAAALRETHPDADVLTAFTEQALSGAEREDVVRHLSRCGDCREVVALSLPPSVDAARQPEGIAEQSPVRQTVDRPRGWLAWPNLRWAALAASVVVVGSVLFLHPGKQTDSTLGTEKLAARGNVPAPTNDAPDAVASARPEPPQTQGASPAAVADQVVTRERRSGARAEKMLGRAQTVVATPPAFLADNKRVDSLQSKDNYSFDAGKFATPPAASGIVAKGEALSTDQASTSSNGTATVSTSVNEVQSAQAQGSLMAKDDAPAPPVEKAKLATKEEAELKSQVVQKAPQKKLSATAYPKSEAAVLEQEQLLKQSQPVAAPQWSLAQGRLQRSLNAGKTWQTALQLDHPVLTFGALGSDVWAGSQSGKLLHSTDGGATWTTIRPSTKAGPLTTDIVAIEMRSATEIILSTSNGESWTTTDAGRTWDKK
jgi:hypothetical protein